MSDESIAEYAAYLEKYRAELVAKIENGTITDHEMFKARILGISPVLINGKVLGEHGIGEPDKEKG